MDAILMSDLRNWLRIPGRLRGSTAATADGRPSLSSSPRSQKKGILMSNPASEHQTMHSTWQLHLNAEFELKDAEAALATMTENPHVFLIPSGTGGTGRQGVRDFYATHFLSYIPPDVELVTVSESSACDFAISAPKSNPSSEDRRSSSWTRKSKPDNDAMCRHVSATERLSGTGR